MWRVVETKRADDAFHTCTQRGVISEREGERERVFKAKRELRLSVCETVTPC